MRLEQEHARSCGIHGCAAISFSSSLPTRTCPDAFERGWRSAEGSKPWVRLHRGSWPRPPAQRSGVMAFCILLQVISETHRFEHPICSVREMILFSETCFFLSETSGAVKKATVWSA